MASTSGIDIKNMNSSYVYDSHGWVSFQHIGEACVREVGTVMVSIWTSLMEDSLLCFQSINNKRTATVFKYETG